jgi:hypothetical protein
MVNVILIAIKCVSRLSRAIAFQERDDAENQDEDQDMDIDDGNKEDEEALATGRESDVCERMVTGT